MDAANLLERAQVGGVALGQLDERRIGQHRADWPVLLGRGALAPGRQLTRHGAGFGVELADAGQALPGAVRVPLVGGRLQAPAFLARPRLASGLAQPALDLVGQLEQVGHVLGGVAELLGGERSRVPAGVAGRLADAAAEHRSEQVAVAGLRAGADEPGRQLRVEQVGDLGPPGAAEDRHVLAAGVEHDLDGRIAQQLRHRRDVHPAAQRIDQIDAWTAAVRRVVHGDLDQAQERPVAALGHELGVDPDPALLARDRRRGGDVLRGGEGVGGVAAGGLGAHVGREPSGERCAPGNPTLLVGYGLHDLLVEGRVRRAVDGRARAPVA